MKASQSYSADRGSSWGAWAARYIHREMLQALGYRYQPMEDGGCYKATRAHTGAVSLDAPLSADDPDGLTLGDTLADDTAPGIDAGLNLSALQRYVRDAVDRLETRQQRCVMDLCGLQELPYSVAAARLGVSVERVRQIRARALKALRKDRLLRENAAADTDLRLRTPYYTRVSISAFNTMRTSATEKAVLWRLNHEERLQRHRDRLQRIRQNLEHDREGD